MWNSKIIISNLECGRCLNVWAVKKGLTQYAGQEDRPQKEQELKKVSLVSVNVRYQLLLVKLTDLQGIRICPKHFVVRH